MASHLVLPALLISAASGVLQMHDPVVVGQTFMAGSTNPTQGSTSWALTSHGIAEKLFTVDKHGNVVGQVAESVRKISTLVWEVTLKAGYKFSDGTEVTADHVKECLRELNAVNDNAKATLGNMTMTTSGNLKVRISSERPTPVMDAVLANWIFVVYLAKGDDWVFTGPFKVETEAPGEEINLVPNPHYPRAAERPLLTIKKYAGGSELAAALEAKEVDMAFHLPVDELTRLRAVDGLIIKTFEVGYHYMMFHNMRNTALSDLNVRKAIDMALDRQALSQELRGGAETRSFFPEDTPYHRTDTAPLHADKSGAETLLTDAGWVLDGQGRRMKAGSQLSLTLVAYPQRPGLALMQPVIKQTLVDLGIAVTDILTDGSSWDQLDTILADKSFDLLMWAQHTLPNGDPAYFLNAFFRSDGGNNHAGLNSTTVDNLLDDLGTSTDMQDRVTKASAVHNEIIDLVPMSNLMTPEWHVGFSARLSFYEPWGSDYYVIRADLGLNTTGDTTTTVQTEADGASQATGGLWTRSLFLLALVAGRHPFA